jgi:Xaa-Pro aminopeptidase
VTAAAAFAGRLERIRARLPPGGAWWITRRQHVRYLTGVLPLPEYPAALLVTGGSVAALWPGAIPAAAPDWVDGRVYDPWAAGSLAGLRARSEELVREHGLRAATVLVDGDSVPLALAGITTPAPGAEVFAAILREKDADEVDAIRRNLAGNDAAFARIARDLRPGVQDLDIAAWAFAELSAHAGQPVGYDADVGLGAGGGEPEAQPTGRVAASGDLVFVDLYPMRDGYGGDSTRSFSLGPPDAWAAETHERLVQALEAAERCIAPGVPAAELDRVCRAAAADGDGVAYPHHTGHGLGLFAQEAPYLVPGSTDELKVGDVVAVEPGAYRAGQGGLRIEDVFAVTADGCERLNAAPRVLEVCG